MERERKGEGEIWRERERESWILSFWWTPVIIKESEKIDKHLDLVRELKYSGIWGWEWYQLKLVCLEKKIEELEIVGRVGSMLTTALFQTARILRRVLEIWEDLLSDSSKRTQTIDYAKNSPAVINSRILRRFQETCCHSASSERPPVKVGVKNSQEVKWL